MNKTFYPSSKILVNLQTAQFEILVISPLYDQINVYKISPTKVVSV